jgi:hypothetical protein
MEFLEFPIIWVIYFMIPNKTFFKKLFGSTRVELRASRLLGRSLSLGLYPQSFFFCFSYFSGGVLCFCLGLASDCHSPTYFSHIAEIKGLFTWLVHIYLLSLANFMPRLALNHNSPYLWLSSS